MFFQLCDVEMGNDKTRRTKELCAVRPLEGGEPSRDIDGKEVWHPDWRGEVKDLGNSRFLAAIVERIWQNEKVSAQISKGTYTYAPYRNSEKPMEEARWRTKLSLSP